MGVGVGGADLRDCTHTLPFTHLRSEVQLPSAAIRDDGFSVSAVKTAWHSAWHPRAVSKGTKRLYLMTFILRTFGKYKLNCFGPLDEAKYSPYGDLS